MGTVSVPPCTWLQCRPPCRDSWPRAGAACPWSPGGPTLLPSLKTSGGSASGVALRSSVRPLLPWLGLRGLLHGSCPLLKDVGQALPEKHFLPPPRFGAHLTCQARPFWGVGWGSDSLSRSLLSGCRVRCVACQGRQGVACVICSPVGETAHRKTSRTDCHRLRRGTALGQGGRLTAVRGSVRGWGQA